MFSRVYRKPYKNHDMNVAVCTENNREKRHVRLSFQKSVRWHVGCNSTCRLYRSEREPERFLVLSENTVPKTLASSASVRTVLD